MGRKSRGRKKVEMVKINNETNLQVTFSKRRSGLFKKASELCTLCGAEVAIVVFSPGRKVFSFGHPCVRTLIQRFLNAGPAHPNQNSATMRIIDAHRDATVRDLNLQLTLIEAQLEMEQKKSQDLKELEKENQGNNWWESPIEELNMTQLDQLESSLEDLKKSVTIQTQNLLNQSAGSKSLFPGASSSINNNNFNSFANNSLNRPFSFNTHTRSHIPDVTMTSYDYKPDFRSGFGNVSEPGLEFKPVFNPSCNQGFGPGFF